MSRVFNTLKTKYNLAVLIKSLILGVAVGAFAFGVTFAVLKILAISLNFAIYALIGVGTAGVVTALCFLLTRANDKAFAKYLDDTYALGEKVSTMVEYADKDGVIVEVQRQTTEEILSKLPKLKPDYKKLWQYPVALALGTAVAVGSIFVPQTPTPLPPEEQQVVGTEYQITRLTSLVNFIKSDLCQLEDGLKTQVLIPLQTILQILPTPHTQIMLNSLVMHSVATIDEACASQTSWQEVKREIKKLVPQTEGGAVSLEETLSLAVTDGVFAYKNVNVKDTTLTKLSQKTEEAVLYNTNQLLTMLSVSKADGLSEKLTTLSSSVTTALANVTYEDDVYTAFNALASDLNTVANQTNEFADEVLQNNLRTAVNAFSATLIPSLGVQAYDIACDVHVREELADIFDVDFSALDFSDGTGGEEDNPSGDDPTGGGGSGGAGSGDINYGSDDLVYDPDAEEWVPYGKLLNKYYAIAREQVENANLTDAQREELQKVMENYFKLLFGLDESRIRK